MRIRRPLLPALALLALAAPHSAPAANYIALGDSYAYGFTTIGDLINAALTNDTASLTGYQGYVKPFSQFLGIPQSNVFNLSVIGETLSSFQNGGNSSVAANLNYAADPSAKSQSALLKDTLTKLGGNVQDITVQLGGNDLLDQALLGNTPDLTAFSAGYTGLLQNLKLAAPNANIFVVGYFDPFTPLGTGNPPPQTNDPFNGLGKALLPGLNLTLQTDAAAAGVKYVDISKAFAGRELQLSEATLPLGESALKPFLPGYQPSLPDSFPNYHPDAAGYQVIAGQLDQAVVPESSAWGLLALGLPVLPLVVRRAKKVS